MRKTKIVCTLGPSTDSTEVMTALVNEGMNVARFNFSHGSYEEHERRLNMLRDCMKESNHYIATLLDTKGPEIRLRDFETGKVELKKNQRFVLTTRNLIGTHEIVSITYENLPKDVTKGTRILIDDGLVELVVEEVKETDIVCIVVNEGVISNKKGVNVPEVNLSMPYLSEKDKNDILFGIEHDFDFISASFVRCADDVQQIRNLLADNGGEKIQIISKIENRQGLDHIDEIIEVSKQAQAHSFIHRLPNGYNTLIEEEGLNFSQGERQLISIARAILSNPEILILDEATSNVDTKTEKYIQAGMRQLMEGRTTFVIAHRLSTIKDADEILVINSGQIVERGNHEELLKNGELYAKLYNSQFE